MYHPHQGTKNIMITICACLSLGFIHASADPIPSLNQEIDPPYVTCIVKGGLGNQLFEIATTLAHAWDHGAIPVFPDLQQDEWNINMHRESIFSRLDTSDCPRPFSVLYEDPDWCSTVPIPFAQDQVLDGYFQIWKRFDHYKDRLVDLFAPSESIVDDLKQKYGELLAHPNTVSIHVRTFAKYYGKIHYFVGMDYYQKAIDLFPSDALFVIFSDRIHWCEQHFSKLGKPCVFIEGNDEVHDFYLMSMMKHHIIPNSTFSWWASYLNQNPGKMTIAPESWQHPDLFAYPMTQPNDLYLPDWKIVVPNYDEPYPSDMYDFDPPPWDGNLGNGDEHRIR